MTRANRWLLWTPFVVAGVILTAWYFVWRAGADAMRGALADFAAEQQQGGAQFAYEPLRAKGFPFLLRGEIGAVAYERGKWRWDADAVYVHASPWAPDRLVFSTGPAMRLTGPKGVWTISADSARASIETAASGWLFKAEAAALSAAAADTAIKTGRGVLNVTPDVKATGAVAISFRLFDTAVKNTRGETAMARLDGALSVEPEPRRVTVHGLDAEIGAARAQISGVVAPDREGRLEGTAAATLTNPAMLVDALRVMGAVRPEETRSIEAGLAIIAAGGGGKIEAPLVFSDGETKLAGVKIGKAPAIGQP